MKQMTGIDLIFSGPPGSGKSLQMENLKRVLSNRFVLSVGVFNPGQVCRQEMASGSPLGERIKQYTENGSLVPDEIIFELWNNLQNSFRESAVVFYDGYPRSVKQVQQLATHGAIEHRRQIAIFLEIPERVCFSRLQGRKDHRSDDRPETIHKRLAVHRAMDQLIRPKLQDVASCVHIDASQCIADVGRDIMRVLRSQIALSEEAA